MTSWTRETFIQSFPLAKLLAELIEQHRGCFGGFRHDRSFIIVMK